MKVIIYTGVLSRKAGGLFYSVPNLTKAINKPDCEATVCGFKDENEGDLSNYKDVNVKIYHTYGPLKNYALSDDVLRIFDEENPDVIHQQGIWSFESLYTLRHKKAHPSCKVIIMPHGMLDPWIVRRSPLKKWIVRKWFEDKSLSGADCLYALCRSEHNSMREFGLKNPIAIIPNGTEIPDWQRDYSLFQKKEVKEIVFISRLHPKKGIIEMIEAYKQVKNQAPELAKKWKIKIAGWGDEEYIKAIQNAIQSNGLDGDIKLLGAVYGKEKEELLKEADAFILPTYSEGLPMAVLEAWAYGLPVITTDFANLPEGFQHGAAFRIENEVSKMAIGLTEFFSKSDEEIISYGKNGYALAKSSFSWEAVGEKTVALYEWLLGQAEKPEFVHLYDETTSDITTQSKG